MISVVITYLFYIEIRKRNFFLYCYSDTLFSFKSQFFVQKQQKEKVFIKISQNLQENNCARVSFLIKLPAVAVDDHHIIQVYYSLILKIFALMLFLKKKTLLNGKYVFKTAFNKVQDWTKQSLHQWCISISNFICFIITLILFIVNLIFIKILLDRL